MAGTGKAKVAFILSTNREGATWLSLMLGWFSLPEESSTRQQLVDYFYSANKELESLLVASIPLNWQL